MNYIAIDKAYIENRIKEIADKTSKLVLQGKTGEGYRLLIQERETLKDILSQGIEIPVEESWKDVNGFMQAQTSRKYPNGVIIKSKT